MRALIGECKFHNCQHLNEPKCAVKEGIEEGRISESRYQTYVQLMTDDVNETYRRSNH
jgi:ribosome biogenesis GTPase